SYNTSKANHNVKELKRLKESIQNANERLSYLSNSKQNENGNLANNMSHNELHRLRYENEQLRTALAEVYRAYMQLLAEYREDTEVDNAFRKILENQSKILGKKRVWEIN
ncbi:hypothetical protein AKH09_24585, partial [Vibrio parahaemolyticus]